VTYELDGEVEPFGRALRVPLPTADGAAKVTTTVAIDYETTGDSAALQWLAPSQTAGKVRLGG